jgi:non-homologous end joining protein Ku
VKPFTAAIAKLAREELDLDELSDRYAAALHDLAEKKAKKGKDIVDARGEPEEEDEGGAEVIDLMKVLKQRLGAARAAPARKAPRKARSRKARQVR